MSLNSSSLLSKIPKGWDNMASQPNSVTILSRFGLLSNFSVEALRLTIGDKPKDEKFKILDVAAGTGTLSIFASSLFQNAEIIANDFSPKMISFFDNVIAQENIKNIKTKVEDGMDMKDYKDNTFDYCYSMFGLIFFPDRSKGLKEMYRVLKPGGKVAIGSWTKEQFFPVILTKAYEQLMGKPLPIEQPILSMSDKNQIINELESAGFKDVEVHTINQYLKELKEYKDILGNRGNPVYDEIYDLISSDKQNEFEKLIVEITKQTYPRRPDGTIKLESPCYIGIGTK